MFIINLPKDEQRRASITRQFDGMPLFHPQFIVAIDGNVLSNNVCQILSADERWSKFKGTIGCFISHVKAWEELSKGSEDLGIILEDDVDISLLSNVNSLDIPADAEIIFLNERMSENGPRSDVLEIRPMACALRRLDETRSGPGGDGYLLTKSGAKKMLHACLNDTYFGHIDGRLMRYATSPSELAKLPSDSWIKSVIMNHHHRITIPTLGLIQGYCLSWPIVRHKGLPSSREAGDSSNENT